MTTGLLSGSLQLVDVRAEIERLLMNFPSDLLAVKRGHDCFPANDSHTPSLLAVQAQISNGALIVQRAALVPCTPENVSVLREFARDMFGVEPIASRDAAETGCQLANSRRRGLLEERPTSRELKVLALVKDGRRNREIAEILHISEDTVKTRMKNVMAKLCASNRTHAVTIARQRGLLDGEGAPAANAWIAM